VVHSGVDAREGGGIVSHGFLTLYHGTVVMGGGGRWGYQEQYILALSSFSLFSSDLGRG